MAKISIPIQKTVYSNSVNTVKNTEFDSYIPKQEPTSTKQIPTIEEFFEYYDILFFQIPTSGENSHNSLVEKSSQYIGLDLEVLLEQLTLLQRQNELLQKQIETLNSNGGTN